jgi:hypothetical protein
MKPLRYYVTCPKCSKFYDDTYRWTFCPHDPLS